MSVSSVHGFDALDFRYAQDQDCEHDRDYDYYVRDQYFHWILVWECQMYVAHRASARGHARANDYASARGGHARP